MAILNALPGRTTGPKLPACAEDSLCAVDGMTGSRAATNRALAEDGLLGGPSAMPVAMAVAAAPGAATLGMPAAPLASAALPRGAVRVPGFGIWTAAQVMQWVQATAEAAQVMAAISRFGLNRDEAADVLAARAYVWAQNILPLNYRYWQVPLTGPVNERVAEAVMRFEQVHPGTVVLATRGDAAALRSLDDLVAEMTAVAAPQLPDTLERTSSISPALSANSTRARTLLGIMGNQRWQAHHLIPWATVARLAPAVQRAIAASGWRMDSLVNLIALPANLQTYLQPPNLGQLPYHNGSHSVRYDGDVWAALQPVAATATTMAPAVLQSAMDAVDLRFRVALRTNRSYHPRLN